MSDDAERTLPPGWAWATFGDVAAVASDLVDPRTVPTAIHIAPNHVESRTGVLLGAGLVSDDEVISPKHRFRPGQIIYSKIRPYLAKATLVTTSGVCSADMYPIDSRIDAGFLLRWMLSDEFTTSASAHQGRSVLPKINQAALVQLRVPVPPLAEQRRIVAKLDDLLARSRRAKEALAAVPALLERYRQAVLAAAFRGDLTAEWREKHPDVEPTKNWVPSTVNIPIPSSWSVARLDQLTEPGTVITYGIVLPGDEIAGGVPYVRQQDIEDGRIDDTNLRHTTREIADKHKRSSLQEDDVLLCIIRHLRVAVVPAHLNGANITQGTVRIRCDRGVLEPRYLALYLQSTYAQGWMKERYFGMAMPRINVADARAIPVPVPPVEEQREMVARIDAALAQSQSMSERIAEADGQLQSLTRAVLASAFRGELVAQDPSDEPASVMLERLRATSPRASARPLSIDGEGPSHADSTTMTPVTSEPPRHPWRGGARKRGVRSPK